MTEATTAGLGAEAMRVPNGWKLVPVEPTEAMWAEGRDAVNDQEPWSDLPAIWSAMLAASPTLPLAAPAVHETGGEGGAIPAGMRPWHGGNSAPEDWDGGDVMWEDGVYGAHPQAFGWQANHPIRIIAYTPKPTPADIAPVEALPEKTLRQAMTAAEPLNWPGGDVERDAWYAGYAACAQEVEPLRQQIDDHNTALVNLTAHVDELRTALRWYAETVGKCRMVHEEGDAARAALDRDCGSRALKALGEKA